MKKEESEAVRTIFESYFDQYSLRADIVNCSTYSATMDKLKYKSTHQKKTRITPTAVPASRAADKTSVLSNTPLDGSGLKSKIPRDIQLYFAQYEKCFLRTTY
jgi:S-methylmethionine-dependent homocysteine/selenocysteine methylase